MRQTVSRSTGAHRGRRSVPPAEARDRPLPKARRGSSKSVWVKNETTASNSSSPKGRRSGIRKDELCKGRRAGPCTCELLLGDVERRRPTNRSGRVQARRNPSPYRDRGTGPVRARAGRRRSRGRPRGPRRPRRPRTTRSDRRSVPLSTRRGYGLPAPGTCESVARPGRWAAGSGPSSTRATQRSRARRSPATAGSTRPGQMRLSGGPAGERSGSGRRPLQEGVVLQST